MPSARRRRTPAPILTGRIRRSASPSRCSVGTARYDFTGQGVCLEIPDGSIFEEPAAIYSVRQTGAKQRFNMTLYRLKKGGDMVTLNLTIGKDTHSVSTVKVGESGAPLGSGTATLERAGKGGTLTIDATDTRRVSLSGTVKCDAFNRPSREQRTMRRRLTSSRALAVGAAIAAGVVFTAPASRSGGRSPRRISFRSSGLPTRRSRPTGPATGSATSESR